MKKPIIINFKFLCFYSCSELSEFEPNPYESLNQNEIIYEEEINTKGNNNNHYTLYKNLGSSYKFDRYDNELKEILREQNIDFKYYASSCYPIPMDSYRKHMDSLIKQQFGSDFIKNMSQKADSIYLAKNRNKTFYHFSLDELPKLSLNQDTNNYNYLVDSFFLSKLKFPNEYLSSTEFHDRFFYDIYPTISKKGKILNIEIKEHDVPELLLSSNEKLKND